MQYLDSKVGRKVLWPQLVNVSPARSGKTVVAELQLASSRTSAFIHPTDTAILQLHSSDPTQPFVKADSETIQQTFLGVKHKLHTEHSQFVEKLVLHQLWIFSTCIMMHMEAYKTNTDWRAGAAISFHF